MTRAITTGISFLRVSRMLAIRAALETPGRTGRLCAAFVAGAALGLEAGSTPGAAFVTAAVLTLVAGFAMVEPAATFPEAGLWPPGTAAFFAGAPGWGGATVLSPAPLSACRRLVALRRARHIYGGYIELYVPAPGRLIAAAGRDRLGYDLCLAQVCGFFHVTHQLDSAIARVRGHDDVQHQIIALGVLRFHRDHVQSGRHDFLHLGEDARPGERLAREELVQKVRLVGNDPVGRLVEDNARLRLFALQAVNLLLRRQPIAD